MKLLWQWGLRVNMELKILICWTCKHGIHPSPQRIMNHLQAKHIRKGKTMRKQHPDLQSRLEVALSGYHLPEPRVIMLQPTDTAPIPGITVHPGFYCPMKLPDGTTCCRTYRQESSLADHLKKTHIECSSKPNAKEVSNYSCNCQTIFTNPVRYFRVKTGRREKPENYPNVYTAFILEELPKLPTKSTMSIERLKNEDLPSLLRGTQWHLYISNYRHNPKDVVDLIRHPDKKDALDGGQALSRLPKIANLWMAMVGRHWEACTANMRKFLNGFPIM